VKAPLMNRASQANSAGAPDKPAGSFKEGNDSRRYAIPLTNKGWGACVDETS
jgi:hypothetical protein